MAYAAKVLEVMIASPGDVIAERQVIREVLNDWNVLHGRTRKAMLVPVGWETHSAPELAGRAQQMINDRLLVHCDLLVGIFWTRLGSDTGVAASGTVEEIEEHIKAGKPAMLYFSRAPIRPDILVPEQFAKLKEFETWAMSKGLVAEFHSVEDFRDQFRRGLELNLRDNAHLAGELAPVPPEDTVPPTGKRRITLSDEAVKLLVAAADTDEGMILTHRSFGGATIKAGRVDLLGDDRSARASARWLAAIEELDGYGMVEATSAKREIFRLLHAGWQAAASLAAEDLLAPEPVGPDLRQPLQDLWTSTQNNRVANNPPCLVSQPSAYIYLVPADALAGPRIDLGKVQAHRGLLAPETEPHVVANQDNTQWWAHGPTRRIGELPNAEADWSARLLRPGVVEQLFTLGRAVEDDEDILVDGAVLEHRIVDTIDRGLQLLDRIGLAGPVLVAMSFYELGPIRIAGLGRVGRFRAPSVGTTPVLLPRGTTQSGDLLHDAFDALWLAAGFAEGSPSFTNSGRWAGYADVVDD
ncbi:hypothetical protein [Caulobacter henricii]|uniref:DUF4062 domain-containing protein n=1 Tax=Caulobacter henricii TaxID=69395 RepID=A0A0P0P4K1_9CAUL|nr:hypothetical protein [Caulobacter henricii]ALL15430.1 hypothetical protein AQ619_18250 [Caulobacter henricii]